MARKIETLRSHGVEILRCETRSFGFGEEGAGRENDGRDVLWLPPEKLISFYIPLCEKALEGAIKQLSGMAEVEFERFLTESHGRGAFFPRFNYSFTLRAERISEGFWRILRSVEVSQRGRELFSQKNADIWDMNEGSIIGEKRLKKCLKLQKEREEKEGKKKRK